MDPASAIIGGGILAGLASLFGDDGKEVITPEIIDPRKRGFRCSDHIFLSSIIEIAVFHR